MRKKDEEHVKSSHSTNLCKWSMHISTKWNLNNVMVYMVIQILKDKSINIFFSRIWISMTFPWYFPVNGIPWFFHIREIFFTFSMISLISPWWWAPWYQQHMLNEIMFINIIFHVVYISGNLIWLCSYFDDICCMKHCFNTLRLR